jgi:hypothetical protein
MSGRVAKSCQVERSRDLLFQLLNKTVLEIENRH